MIACEVGFLTSPVGANLSVAARLTKLAMDHILTLVILFVFTSFCDRGHLLVPRIGVIYAPMGLRTGADGGLMFGLRRAI